MHITILDAVILIALIVGFVGGWRKGVFTEVCSVVGIVVIAVVSWALKGKLSVVLYRVLPFFKFGGDFEGISSLNILLYELISFLIIAGVLSLILVVILKITGAVEKILRSTVLLGLPSKILGGIAGVIEAYLIVFIVLCILSQPYITFVNVKNDTFAKKMLDKTPLLSNAVNDVIHSGEEIIELVKNNKQYTKEQLDHNTLEILLKNEVVNPDAVDYLADKGKLTVKDAKSLASKYRK